MSPARKRSTSAKKGAATRKRKPTTSEWFQTVRNYALHANQAGSYDAVLEYLRRT